MVPSTPGRSAAINRGLLVVNADDYGLTRATSEAILTAHRTGIVTSTSVLTLAPGFATTARWLSDEPSIGVGVHLALVGEDPPLLSASEVPTLVDGRGRLAASWRNLVPRLVSRRVDPADIQRELTAQLDAAKTAGLLIDHLDTHQHLHLWPAVADVVVELAIRFGVPAVRVPRSSRRGPKRAGIRRLARRLETKVRRAGLVTSDISAGLDEAGNGEASSLRATIDALGCAGQRLMLNRDAPVAELGCHPGAAVDKERSRYRWGYRWADELAALTDPSIARAAAAAGLELVTWRQVARAR